MTAAGRELLREFEGVIPFAYDDPSRFATFGVGHLIARRPVNADDRRRWGTRANPKPELVEPTLIADLAERREVIERLLPGVELNRNESDAVQSLVFNIGAGEKGFEGSTVRRLLLAGDHRGAADAFLMWRNAPGHPGILLPRRRRERALFLTPVVKPMPRPPVMALTPNELAWCREFDRLRMRKADPDRMRELIMLMTAQRKRIWRLAQPRSEGGDGGGWAKAHRRARYEALRVRTR